ncbi:MAG: polymer-forming cytoskeletal protein [Blastocatellia bacterium]|nr:polymer-forming cytoskeletal protein [Blastocatellia bacterium]
MSEESVVKQTILEDGTEFDGTVRSKCPITVSGKLKGEVSAPSLTVTPSGLVHGQVKVTQLKSKGELAGEIDAESVELSGRVSDQTTIRATTLEVTLNQTPGKLQVTFGNCELLVGDKTAKPQEVAKPPAQVQENRPTQQQAPPPVKQDIKPLK